MGEQKPNEPIWKKVFIDVCVRYLFPDSTLGVIYHFL